MARTSCSAQAFAVAARAAAPPADTSDDPANDAADPESAKVLRAFVRDGRLTSIPTARSKRLVVLDVLAQEFEPGRRYSEQMVNLMLGQVARGHCGAAPLPRRRGLPRPGERRVLARGRHGHDVT